jgi:uncharacterized membrane protein YczE
LPNARTCRRLAQLYAALAAYGFSTALRLRARLGLDPWAVFHQGLAHRLGVSFGTASILTGIGVLGLWLPLREKPGIGTISNIVVIGLSADASLAALPDVDGLPARWMLVAVGTLLTGIASAAYIGAGLGPGPRDGVMTGLARRTRWPIGRIRTGIEIAALVCGWLLGGSVGLATLFYAVTIGPVVHRMMPLLEVRKGARAPA